MSLLVGEGTLALPNAKPAKTGREINALKALYASS